MRLPASSASLVRYLIHTGARFARPLTMGVRAVVIDESDRVYLVKHSYVPGWHLPGGGVEPGETVFDALVRETREECNIVIQGEAALHGVFFNRGASKRDHVVVYVVRSFQQTAPREPDWEIVEGRFFGKADLPDDTARGSRARLRETLDGAPKSGDW